MRKQMTWPGLLVLSLLAGCQLDSGANGDDAGAGGTGGGGNGGESTADAGSGGGVNPDTPCNQLSTEDCPQRGDCVAEGDACRDAEGAACELLRADQCAERADCAARVDAFSDFVDCKPLAEVACSMLDEARCGDRDDCAWDGSACGVPAVACEARADQGDCETNNCFWYADACHATPEPANCNQPDEVSCLDANCEWTPDGCREPVVGPMNCAELAEVACSARADCIWAGDHCEVDQQNLPCEQLDMEPCALRNDCAWDQAAAVCIVRPAGECEQLDEFSCVARPDCLAQYEVPVGCDQPPPAMGGGANGGGGQAGAGGAAGAPDPGVPAEPPADAAPAPPCPPDDPACNGDPPACAPIFIGCRTPQAPSPCDALAPDVCLETPGCHLEEGCAPCPPGQVCPAVCEVVQLCVSDVPQGCFQLTPDVCAQTPGCHLEMAPGVCDCVIDADGREICNCIGGEAICVPDAPGACEQIFDANICWNSPGCAWVPSPDCGAPLPCDCAPDDPNCACDAIIAPACGMCVTDIPQDPCANLPPDVCAQVDGCMVQEIPCDCGVDAAGEPILCDCDAQLVCVQAPPACSYFDEASCVADPTCEWFGFGMEPPPVDCPCDPADAACECARPIPVDGFCQVRFVEPCAATPVDLCEATPGCGVQSLQPPCLPCDPADPECPVCEPILSCVPLGDICGQLDPVTCASEPRCEVFEQEICMGGGEACPPGVDCPPPVPGVCEVQQYCGPARNRCVNIGADACAQMNSCVALTDAAGNFDICWDANSCDGLTSVQCDAHPSCHVEIFDGPCGCFIDENGREICECAPGGEFCVSDVQPPPPPPPVGADCRADADCPAGAFCDAAMGICVFPL